MNLSPFRPSAPPPANGHAPGSDAGPAAAARPLSVPVGPRRRRPALAAAGVALVAVGGLAAASAVRQAQGRAAVLAITRSVPLGGRIAAADLTVVHLPAQPALRPLSAAAEPRVLGARAAVALAPGALLVPADVTTATVPAPGQQLVGLTLAPGQLPARALAPGDPVLLVLTSGVSADPAATPATVAGVVVDEGSPNANGDTPLDVTVAGGIGPHLAAAAAGGHVAVLEQSAGGGR